MIETYTEMKNDGTFVVERMGLSYEEYHEDKECLLEDLKIELKEDTQIQVDNDYWSSVTSPSVEVDYWFWRIEIDQSQVDKILHAKLKWK
ncbi:MAG: hypothetical protein ABF876_09830 [Acetobacter aceti]|uniref:Uncharacterized protein n=1 Tax=Acetobacter aceti TaxID=435 RepID=A0A1U9KH63_ACEAC|nr:hypothetical protein [Acetobacter aceti]AQS85141.1 hypothetical protein A0U92_10505 [Acetobacter aceti]